MRVAFYQRFGKRWFDASCALAGLAILSPLLLIVALAVKLTSRGPAFFRQDRVGQFGKKFRMVKFRSMQTDPRATDSLLTAAGDPRITPLGAWLRRTKIDELPQLFNVLAGDMSLVGPRPEVPKYAAAYTERQRRVLRIKPGITCPCIDAQEEELLARQHDPESFYRTILLPAKLEEQLAYTEHVSFWNDLKVVWKTLGEALARFIGPFQPAVRTRRLARPRNAETQVRSPESADPT